MIASSVYDYHVNFRLTSPDPTMWVLVLFRTLGAWGNTIFVIASAWFLCMSDKVKPNKAIKLVLDVFAISVVILIIALALGVNPGAKTVIKCLLPTTFANNWFITAYILLYVMHPAINWTIERLGKRGHAALTIALVLLYMVLPMATGGLYFWTELVFMVSVYVVTAYVRRNMQGFASDAKANLAIFLVGTLGMILLVVLLEVAGQHVGALSDKMLHFDVDGDPFLMLSCLGLFNLVRLRPFTSKAVNSASALMLFVYLIHENVLVRTYLRPAIWSWIYGVAGYDSLLLWVVLFSLALFAASLAAALLYESSLGKAVNRAGRPVEDLVIRAGRAMIDRLSAIS